MEMYKEATKQRLRFTTGKGPLSVEQLWDLSVEELDALAVHLESEFKNSAPKSFLTKKTAKDRSIKLRFDIAVDILTSKVEEQEALTNASEIKKHNEKILALIAKKQEGELEGKSVADLQKMLK